AEIKFGLRETLKLGNLNAKRDWGYAKEYVEAMWLMLQQDKPEDFVIATGKTYTIREFAEKAALHAGYELIWQGSGIEEKGIDRKTGKTIIEVDTRYFRPAEVDLLVGNPTKAEQMMGWKTKVEIDELVSIMMKYDME